MPSISGEARVGSTLALTLAMPRRPPAEVKATITELDPERRFSWHGNIDRFFAGTRAFEIDPQPDGSVLVTHVETVTGLFFPVFPRRHRQRDSGAPRQPERGAQGPRREHGAAQKLDVESVYSPRSDA